MSLHNYFFDGKKNISFEWGSLREDYYKLGDKLSWNWVVRPDICNNTVVVTAFDDSISDPDTGYYLITLENDIFRDARLALKSEYDEQMAVIIAVLGSKNGG